MGRHSQNAQARSLSLPMQNEQHRLGMSLLVTFMSQAGILLTRAHRLLIEVGIPECPCQVRLQASLPLLLDRKVPTKPATTAEECLPVRQLDLAHTGSRSKLQC
jgi:hypothetical protein